MLLFSFYIFVLLIGYGGLRDYVLIHKEAANKKKLNHGILIMRYFKFYQRRLEKWEKTSHSKFY